MKVPVLAIVIVYFCLFFAVTAWAIEAPQEQITITGRRPAGYDHRPHLALGLKCGTCHHKSKDAPYSNEEVRELGDGSMLHCRSCHNDRRFSEAKLNKIKLIMHKLCKECHKTGVNGVKGPLECTACHKKIEE
jgi:hypothetical protein